MPVNTCFAAIMFCAFYNLKNYALAISFFTTSTGCKKSAALSTAIKKMCIKYFQNIFSLAKILFNIVKGIWFPVLTNPYIYKARLLKVGL